MAGFLTFDGFKSRTIMPSSVVDQLEQERPGWIQTRLDSRSSRIYAQLRKRYAINFDATNPPLIILDWLTDLVTFDAFMFRGFDPNSEQDAEIRERAKTALSEINQASDSETGLFDLPLIEGQTATGVSAGGPFAYSEQSPYTWTDVQADAAREEDFNGGR